MSTTRAPNCRLMPIGPGPTSRSQPQRGLVPRRRFCQALFGAAVGGVVLRLAGTASAATRGYQLKAAFLFHFVQFVEWPDGTFADAKSPIILATLGPDPFEGALDEAVAGKAVGGRPLVVKHFASAAEVGKCQLLFVPARGAEQFPEALRNAGPRGVLSVGETDDFLKAGGIIRFYQEENRLRFQIDSAAAANANLQISAKLLRLGNPHA